MSNEKCDEKVAFYDYLTKSSSYRKHKSPIFAAVKMHAPLFPLALCLMAGIAVSGWLPDWTTGLAALAVSVACTALLYRWPRCQTAGLWLCALLLGMTLASRHQRQLEVAWPKERIAQEVIIIEEPILKERWVTANVLTATGHHKLRLHIQKDEDSRRLRIGDGLVVDTYIKKVRARRRDSVHKVERDHFDYCRYMQCHGFVGESFVWQDSWQWAEVSLKGLSRLERLRLRFLCWRHQLLERYRLWGISDDAYGVLAAMTLGEKTHIDQQTRETYREVGASHILALSGLHLMIIYSVITLLVSWQRIRLLSHVLIILSIWAFALLTGLSPSIVRASLMITVYALLALGYREKMSVNTLAFVAVVMIVVNPLALYDFGFQLSFTAVLAIVLINPLLYGLIPPHILMRHRLLKAIWGLATVSISAQIGTAPLVAYYFGYFSTVFLPTNYIVIPLTTLILYLTPLLLAVSWWSWGVTLIATSLSLLVRTMNQLLAWIATLPHSTIDGISLSTLQVLLLYVIIGSTYVAVSLRYQEFRQNG